MKGKEDETRSPEHTLLQKPKHSIHKPCLTQQKEHEDGIVRDAVEGNIRKENRKVIVRSSYFQHKSGKENAQQNKENILIKDNPAENVVCESAVVNGYSNGSVLKRKEYTNDSFPEVSTTFDLYVLFFRFHFSLFLLMKVLTVQPLQENVKSKQMCIATDEGKFGSNVSHLAQYSDIAEKSMEKFVSTISSFRFSTSGSRAIGLRAPLKDVRNTCINR